ncbi:hypothetical protein TNCV_4277721 [Trichonephila clavipes]|nr:hypothetical protein TNCV_4277721 [Trichonephila clavipes]
MESENGKSLVLMILIRTMEQNYEMFVLSSFLDNVSRFYATNSKFKSLDRQGRLIPSDGQKMSKKLAWELNAGGFTSGLPPDSNLCSCTLVPKAIKAEISLVGLSSHWMLYH